MSAKKTDLVKHLAKKLDGKMKSAGVPPRFAQGSADVAARRAASAAQEAATPRLVSVACRLPADLVNRMRERAVTQEGGVNAVMALALAQWLEPVSGT
jgi:hypothetical protein